ncbi:MAG: NAD(P)-dependent oxidoreductase [Bacteroidota bacterium]
MKIIITGATGSLGAYLLRYFAKSGHEIIALGRSENPPQKLLDLADTYIKADIREPFQLPEADICIHAAAMSDDSGSRDDFYQSNVVGTQNVLAAAVGCNTFIQVSSSSVYYPSEQPLSEADAGQPSLKKLSNYGWSKLLAEQEVEKASSFERVFILRPRVLYGAGDKMIMPRLMRMVKSETFNCPGPMAIAVSMTHYDNFCHAIEACLDSPLRGTHIFNLADEETYQLIEASRLILEAIYGHRLAERQIPESLVKVLGFLHIGGLSPLLVRALTKPMVLDQTAIKTHTNYEPKRSLQEALTEISAWVSQIGGPAVLAKADRSLAWL